MVLAHLVDRNAPPTLLELDAVSTPGLAITREVVEAIRSLPASEKALATDKLAGEVALARTLEKALLLRRMLLAGQQVPEIAASPAREDIRRKVAAIDREIDTLLLETRVRREVVSHTAARLLREYRRRKGRSLTVPISTYSDPKPVHPGAGVEQ